ncbi:MAG: pyridoxamine 5'-phosphate oxidase [Candidatus Eisenbacteria bacterium]
MRVRPPRTDYRLAQLTEAATPAEPFALFTRWFSRILKAGGPDPHAFALATASRAGAPSVRMMLLKEWSEAGFVFATNQRSRKGREIAATGRASMLFYWPALQRQVRIEGPIAPVAERASDEYFGERPRDAQLGAWASRQSTVIAGRDTLTARLAAAAGRFEGRAVERPAYWGGYRLEARRIEFWQGRASRLHDRILYTRTPRGWKKQRLSP